MYVCIVSWGDDVQMREGSCRYRISLHTLIMRGSFPLPTFDIYRSKGYVYTEHVLILMMEVFICASDVDKDGYQRRTNRTRLEQSMYVV